MTTPTPDFRALCAELLAVIEGEYDGTDVCYELRHRARADLATPPPAPPTDEEIQQWGSQLADENGFSGARKSSPGNYWIFDINFNDLPDIARAVLERWGQR